MCAARAMQAQEWLAIRQVDAVLTHSDAEAALIARAMLRARFGPRQEREALAAAG